MATNQDLRDLRPGDTVRFFLNGRTTDRVLTYVGRPIVCSNERSGAFGHVARLVEWASGTGNGWVSTSVDSDDYLNGLGYPTHDYAGLRTRGVEVIEKGTDDDCERARAAGSKWRELCEVAD